MKRFWSGNYQAKICVPIVQRTPAAALRAITQANRLGDLIELRVDFLRNPRLAPLLAASQKSLIVTNRRAEEGGMFKGDEEKRLATLREAIDLGVEFVDVELRSERRLLRELWAHKKGSRVICSFHDFEKTPSPKALRVLLAQMMCEEPDVVKIATMARSWEDNLGILSLLPYAREKKQTIVAFCMGEKGTFSRIFGPFLGSAWTYASLDRERASAPGQIPARQMREIWERCR